LQIAWLFGRMLGYRWGFLSVASASLRAIARRRIARRGAEARRGNLQSAFCILSRFQTPREPLCSGALILAGLTLFPAMSVSQTADMDRFEPPVAYRPANFSGAIGWGFRVQMRSTRNQVQAEEPLILTLTITGNGNVQEIERPDLRRLPRFAEQFHIENLSDRALPAEKTREFDYRLRPRQATVKEVPPLPFVFFNPKILPPEKGYQTAWAQAIPITVQPRAQVSPARVEGTAQRGETPDSVYQLVKGLAVLRYDPPAALPGPLELGALLIGPPMLGVFWYILWRRHYPDVARQARKRRSRAAQNTLRAVRRISNLDASAQAQQMESILAEYLRQRFELSTVEPTPAEVARHLEQTGSSKALAQEMARLFGRCDAARFAPGLVEKPDSWSATASRLVLALEEESWSSQLF
jgi:hypothetical protein